MRTNEDRLDEIEASIRRIDRNVASATSSQSNMKQNYRSFRTWYSRDHNTIMDIAYQLREHIKAQRIRNRDTRTRIRALEEEVSKLKGDHQP